MNVLNALLPTLLIAYLLSFSGFSQADDYDLSWSLDLNVEPTKTQIAGTQINEFNSEIVYIEPLTCDHPSLNQQKCQQVEESGGQFEMIVDGNQDGRYERWSIAVAKLKGGEYAKVLLIQDELNSELMQLLFVEANAPGFSALYLQQGQVMWGMCLSCDVLADIVWQQGQYQLQWEPKVMTVWSEQVLVNNH